MGSDKRKITSKDVAREAGVSQTLVSFVLNNAQDKKINPATREKVIETARRLGYRVNIHARNMRTSKAEAIGFLSEWDLTSFAAAPVLKVNNRYRYRILLIGRNNRQTREQVSWLLKRFAGDRANRGTNLFVDCNPLE